MALRSGYYGIKGIFNAKKLGKIAETYDQDLTNIWADMGKQGAKNLLFMTAADIKFHNTAGTWDGNAYTFRGVTYTLTVNDAGYVTQVSTSGTATGGTSYIVLKYDHVFKAGMIYTLSGCGKYGQDVWVGLYNTNTSQYVDANSKDGVDQFVGYDVDTTRQVRIRIGVGIDTSTFVFKPMIRYAADLDATFQPYAMTNQELTASAVEQKATINAIITAATGAADFAAFKAAMEAITPVTRSLSREASPEDVPEEVKEEVIEEKPATKKTTRKTTVKEGE